MTYRPLKVDVGIAGKCALVTGSIGGIGYATVRALAGQGCRVMMNGLGDMAEIEQKRKGLADEFRVKVGFNIASNLGLTGTVDRGDYVATKHGVVGLTRAVALEGLPHRVTCNAICPGATLTPHAERQLRERMERSGKSREETVKEFLAQRQPSGRFVLPEQVADSIVFLCSEAASEMTGSPISIDGGWYAM